MNYGKTNFEDYDNTNDTLSLAEKLKATLDILVAANILKPEDQAKADIKLLVSQRDEIQNFVASLKHQIIQTIQEGKVPWIVFEKDTFGFEWLTKVRNGNPPFFEIWKEFVKWLRSEYLDIIFSYEDKVFDKFDKIIPYQNIVITVVTLDKNVAYRG